MGRERDGDAADRCGEILHKDVEAARQARRRCVYFLKINKDALDWTIIGKHHLMSPAHVSNSAMADWSSMVEVGAMPLTTVRCLAWLRPTIPI